MDRRIAPAFLLAFAVAACGGKDGDMKRGQQQYDVVEEGSASGVSSTINPLNEQPLATAPVTNTAADTTTNFTLPNTLPPATTTDAGTIAGTLPPPVYRPPSRPAPPPRRTEPAPMASSSTSAETAAQNTDTSAPATENDPATNVEGENKEPEKKNETPPPPPPPATATDTGGQ